MNKITNKKLLLGVYFLAMLVMLVYGLHIYVPLKIFITLLTKNTSGMLFIMINLKVVHSLVEEKDIVLALAIVATVRNFSSIICQFLAGYLLDYFSYSFLFMICFIVMIICFIMVIFYKVPSGNDKTLFM